MFILWECYRIHFYCRPIKFRAVHIKQSTKVSDKKAFEIVCFFVNLDILFFTLKQKCKKWVDLNEKFDSFAYLMLLTLRKCRWLSYLTIGRIASRIEMINIEINKPRFWGHIGIFTQVTTYPVPTVYLMFWICFN